MIYAGQYIPGDGVIHRLDPRVKLLWVMVLSILIFQVHLMGGLLITLLITVIGPVAGISLRRFLSALKPLFILVGLLFLLHAFFSDGPILFALPALSIKLTSTGLYRGGLVAWQFLCMVTAGLFLTLTTPPSVLVMGLERLFKPLKRIGIPAEALAMMVSLALRFLPTLLMEFALIRDAQLARGADYRTGSLKQRLRAVSALTLPLILGTFRRADALVEAMEARGYRPGPRTGLRTLQFTTEDAGAFLLLGFLVAILEVPLLLRLV